MKKLLAALCIATTIIAASCKKSDDNGNNNTNTSKGSWQAAGTTYNAKSVSSSSSGGIYELIAFSDTSVFTSNTITFFFKSGKPATGTYRVAGIADTSANTVYTSVDIVSAGGNNTYNTTGNGNLYATVTVNGNSVSVTMPEAYSYSFFTGDSIKVSANAITLQ